MIRRGGYCQFRQLIHSSLIIDNIQNAYKFNRYIEEFHMI